MPRCQVGLFKKMKSSHFSPDTLEFMYLLHEFGVRYLIVGGEAVIYYGHARLTGDVDFFYEREEANAGNMYKAIHAFWDGAIPGDITVNDLMQAGVIIQFGQPPNRIDIINTITGVTFGEAWAGRRTEKLSMKRKHFSVYILGLEHLRKNKKVTGRYKDLEDLRYLNRIGGTH